MVNRLWQIGIWQAGIWQNIVFLIITHYKEKFLFSRVKQWWPLQAVSPTLKHFHFVQNFALCCRKWQLSVIYPQGYFASHLYFKTFLHHIYFNYLRKKIFEEKYKQFSCASIIERNSSQFICNNKSEANSSYVRANKPFTDFLFKYAEENLAVLYLFIKDPYYTLIKKDEQVCKLVSKGHSLIYVAGHLSLCPWNNWHLGTQGLKLDLKHLSKKL